MTASILALLAAILPTVAHPAPVALPHWSQCDADDAECDAETEDDGDLCAVADCSEDD